MRLDPLSVIRLLRAKIAERPRQAAREVLSAQLDREVERIFMPDLRRDISKGEIPDSGLEPEVCDLCGEPPGPGHEGCNRAIAAGLD